MKTVRKIFIFLILLLQGCEKDKFGQSALDFVRGGVRVQSENLVKRDLPLRYLRAHQVGLEEIIYRTQFVSKKLADVEHEISALEENMRNGEAKNNAWNRLKFSRKYLPTLLDFKADIEATSQNLKSINEMCREEAILKTSIPALGVYAPLASLQDLQRMAVEFEPVIRVQAGGDISTDGQASLRLPDGSADMKDERGALHATALTAGTIVGTATCGPCGPVAGIIVAAATEFIGQMFIANTERRKYNEERKKLDEAIEEYPQNTMNVSNVVFNAENDCKQASDEYQNELTVVAELVYYSEMRWKENYKYALMQEQMGEKFLLQAKVKDLVYTPEILASITNLEQKEIQIQLARKIGAFRVDISSQAARFIQTRACLEKYKILDKVIDQALEAEVTFSTLKNSDDIVIQEMIRDFSVWISQLRKSVQKGFDELRQGGRCDV